MGYLQFWLNLYSLLAFGTFSRNVREDLPDSAQKEPRAPVETDGGAELDLVGDCQRAEIGVQERTIALAGDNSDNTAKSLGLRAETTRVLSGKQCAMAEQDEHMFGDCTNVHASDDFVDGDRRWMREFPATQNDGTSQLHSGGTTQHGTEALGTLSEITQYVGTNTVGSSPVSTSDLLPEPTPAEIAALYEAVRLYEVSGESFTITPAGFAKLEAEIANPAILKGAALLAEMVAQAKAIADKSAEPSVTKVFRSAADMREIHKSIKSMSRAQQKMRDMGVL